MLRLSVVRIHHSLFSLFISGAKGIEDWAPPFPNLCSRLSNLIQDAKKIAILESLLSAIILKLRHSEIPNPKLNQFYHVLIENSPLTLPIDKKYSMENLFKAIKSKYEV